MGILKLITYAAGVAALGLSGYLAKILDETNLMEQVASMPGDHIMYFHIAAAVVIVWLVIGLFMQIISKAIIIALLVLAVAAEGTFLGMNLNGTIVENIETLEQLKEKGEDLLDDLKDKIGN